MFALKNRPRTQQKLSRFDCITMLQYTLRVRGRLVKTCTVSISLPVSRILMLDPFLRLPGFDITPGGEKKDRSNFPSESPETFAKKLDREGFQLRSMRSAWAFLTDKSVLFHRKVRCSFEIQQHGRTFSGRLKHVRG